MYSGRSSDEYGLLDAAVYTTHQGHNFCGAVYTTHQGHNFCGGIANTVSPDFSSTWPKITEPINMAMFSTSFLSPHQYAFKDRRTIYHAVYDMYILREKLLDKQ